MKTTIDLPDDLFIAAKRRAAEDRGTLKAMVERGLRAQLAPRATPRAPAVKTAKIRWVTVDGGLPRELDVGDRVAMHDWLRNRR